MSETEIKKVVDEINKTLHDRKEVEADQAKEIKRLGDVSAETKQKLDKIQETLGQLDDLKETTERLEKLAARPNLGSKGDGDPHYEVNKKHLDAFENAIRHKNDGSARQKLFEAEAEAKAAGAFKAVSVGTAAAGGHALPEVISREIHRLAVELSPMRSVARVITVGSTDYKELVDTLGASGGWVGETTARAETNTPGLEQVALTFGGVYAYPKATNWSLQDLFFDVAAWLRNAAVEQFDLLEGAAYLTGDGTNKPTGMIAGAKSSSGDDDSPARAFGTIEYVPTGKAADFNNMPFDSPPGSGADVFIDAETALRERYLARAAWMMNRNTLSKVRKFKDANGDYIWQPGLQKGEPSTILGYPVIRNPNMASVGANAYPVAFGDYREAYTIADIPGIWMLLDQITAPGFTKYYMEKRTGGKLIKDEALKLIKCATA